MNHFFKIIILLSATISLFSCSDEFVNEKLAISGIANSAIIISPDWEADNYEFQIKGIKEGDFTINSKPEWLNLDSRSGKFTDSIATVHGTVSADPQFSKIGIYFDQMIITSGGKQYAVPVYYIIEGNPAVGVNRVLEIAYNNITSQLHISNTGEGVLLWDIVSMPDWLKVDMGMFNSSSLMVAQGDIAYVPFTLDAQAAAQGTLSGTIVLKTNDKNNPQVEIAVTADFGTPDLNIYTNKVDFGTSETSKNLEFNNYGNGLLIWSIEGLPEWLSVSPASGLYPPYHSSDVILTCDRSKLQAGYHSATISLKTNSPNETVVPLYVSVRVAGYNANVRALEGNIVDAVFNKAANTLYYITSQPNKLVMYDVTAKTIIHEVTLSKAPTSMGISEDFTKAAVGHGGLISALDLTTYSVTKTVEYGYSIYDIEWTKDDWFCFTKAGTYMNNMQWVNLSTLQTAQSDDQAMDEGTNMKKVPLQSYVVAARRYTSPSGIVVLDTNTRLQKNYRHQSIGNFWFTSDGKYMVDASGSVYSTNALVTPTGRNPEDITAIGKLVIPGNSWVNNIPWIDYSAASRSLWAIAPESALIHQYEDNDYTLVKTYAYDNLYMPEGQTASYSVAARYVFANNEATELSVLRKGTNNTTWSIEFIPIQ